MIGPLISTGSLLARLDDPGIVVLEVSFYEPDKAAYFTSHIPGARYAYWKHLLWHEFNREFPTPQMMADRLGSLGVGDDTMLVLVGDPVQFATYAYWVLAMTGFEAQSTVLDGGRITWKNQGNPMTADLPVVGPRSVAPGAVDASCRIGRDDVRAGLDDPSRVLIDLRSGEEYSGERVAPLSAPFDHGAERCGHIPGARNLPSERLLKDDGTFRALDDMRVQFAAVGVSDGQDVVTSCRLGHRASLGWFVLTRLLGRNRVRVYDGSWTEWGSIVGFPVER
jgi:thiosulfate/3-mercaptopyruvate sulfurtransferase